MHRPSLTLAAILAALLIPAVLTAARPSVEPAANPAVEPDSWRDDSVWYDGKAEWALYEAERTIYEETRRYEATIFVNKEQVDPERTVKAEDWRDESNVEMFKHTISQIIPAGNYDYRFLTSSYLHTSDLTPFKVMSSSQEDCGTAYREFLVREGRVEAWQSNYFPGTGRSEDNYRATSTLAFHELLSLSLRDYPFAADRKPELTLQLVPSQENNRETRLTPRPARVDYIGRETLEVPYGELETHHLRVRHAEDGGATESHFWFAADPSMQHVMVQYTGPYEVTWRLKRFDRWAYWSDPRPE